MKKQSPIIEAGLSRKFKITIIKSDLVGNFLDNRLFWIFLGIWLIPMIFSLIFIAIEWQHLPNELPLFYSRIWGAKQLTKSGNIFLPILAVFIVGLIDFLLALIFYKKDRMISYLLLGAAGIISILSVITIFNIVYLFI